MATTSIRAEFRFKKDTPQTFESIGSDTTYVLFSKDGAGGVPRLFDYVLLSILNWKVDAPGDASKVASLSVGADGQGIAFDANADFDFHTLEDAVRAARKAAAGPGGGGGGDAPINIGGKPKP